MRRSRLSKSVLLHEQRQRFAMLIVKQQPFIFIAFERLLLLNWKMKPILFSRARLKSTRAILVASAKANVGAVQVVKSLFLGFWSGEVRSTPRLFQMLPQQASAPLSSAKWCLTQSSIPTHGGAIMRLMCLTSSTIASIIHCSSQTNITTSMALRISGTRPSVICVNLMGFPRSILGYFWRNASGVLTTTTQRIN